MDISATGWSLVQRSPTECVCVSFDVIRSNSNPLRLQWVGRKMPQQEVKKLVMVGACLQWTCWEYPRLRHFACAKQSRQQTKTDVPNVSAGDGMGKYYMCYGATEWRMLKQGRERTRRTPWQWVTQSEVEMGRPYGKNGPAQMGTRCISVGRKNWQMEDGRPRTRWTDAFKRVSGGQWSRRAKKRSEWSTLTQHS
jgi:hypothetical protein